MTAEQMAELRGELFGLKVLLMQCLTQLAQATPSPVAFLDDLAQQAFQGIAAAEPAGIPSQHRRAFQNAAAGIVVQAVEAAKVPHEPAPPPGRRQ